MPENTTSAYPPALPVRPARRGCFPRRGYFYATPGARNDTVGTAPVAAVLYFHEGTGMPLRRSVGRLLRSVPDFHAQGRNVTIARPPSCKSAARCSSARRRRNLLTVVRFHPLQLALPQERSLRKAARPARFHPLPSSAAWRGCSHWQLFVASRRHGAAVPRYAPASPPSGAGLESRFFIKRLGQRARFRFSSPCP